MADIQTKTCSACGQEKLLADFHRNARATDGRRSACKPCTLAINRASILRHHEKRKAEKRAVYYVVRDTPEYQAQIRAYTLANKEAKQAYDRAYRKRVGAEVGRNRARAWQKANPEKRAAIVHNYTARRRAQTKGGVSTAALATWAKAARKVCYWCGTKCTRGYHIDHYTPLSKGGAHELANLVIACGPCNLKKNAKDPLDFAREVGRLL